MSTESGDPRGNPRIYELIEHAPKEGQSSIWAWPEVVEYFKVAGQPVQGPWPPHQEPRPDPTDESLPVAVRDPQSDRSHLADRSAPDAGPAREPGGGPASY